MDRHALGGRENIRNIRNDDRFNYLNLKKKSTKDDPEKKMWPQYSPTATANRKILNSINIVISEGIHSINYWKLNLKCLGFPI